MARVARTALGGYVYHVINRGNGRAVVFHGDEDYRAFLDIVTEVCHHVPLRVLGYCLMPNHFHLLLWPRSDGDLARWMQRLMTTQVRRHHSRHGSEGHLWQGRFKACPVQRDRHLLNVLAYVEANPLRAGLVKQAVDWPWSSLHQIARSAKGLSLARSPVARPDDWEAAVGAALTPDELARLRLAVNGEFPYGSKTWVERTAKKTGRPAGPRPRGRPRKRQLTPRRPKDRPAS